MKPSFYAKGNEYLDSKKDLTGNIDKEIKELEKNKGKLFLQMKILIVLHYK